MWNFTCNNGEMQVNRKGEGGALLLDYKDTVIHTCQVSSCFHICTLQLQYDNEKLVGEGLKDFLAKENGRQQLFITSKVWNDRHRPKEVRWVSPTRMFVIHIGQRKTRT